MTVCCEHNPCPDRPQRLIYRFTRRPWRCPQCGQFWVTRPRTLWGDPDGYYWVRVTPNTSPKETNDD